MSLSGLYRSGTALALRNILLNKVETDYGTSLVKRTRVLGTESLKLAPVNESSNVSCGVD
jgi:hypothetical protein